MKRLIRAIMVVQGASLLLLLGCNKPCVLPENLVDGLDLAARSSEKIDPLDEWIPPSIKPSPKPPRTVDEPKAIRRPISLEACIALALENGRLNGQNIRVLAYNPALAAADIEQALSKFDTQLVSVAKWTGSDPFGGTLPSDGAQVGTQLIKPLPTGGVAGINFNTNYTATPGAAAAANAYEPTLTFTFEQPLLQNYGVFINELLPSGPAPLTVPLQITSGPGILLARITFDQSRAQFELQVQQLVLVVETAYWNLYANYWNYYARDQLLQVVAQQYSVGRKRLDAGQITVQDLALLEQTYHQTRADRASALESIFDAENVLRQTIGLLPEDGSQLVPTDKPAVAPYVPNWEQAMEEALRLRPELIQARQQVQQGRLNLTLQENFLLPDLRLITNYQIDAGGNSLDGAGPNNALRQLASNHFDNWSVGLQMQLPIGFRNANASVRKASLQVAQSIITLQDLEKNAAFELTTSYRQMVLAYAVVGMEQARRLAAAREVEARLKEFKAGLGEITFLLNAEQSLATALQAEQAAIGSYNSAIADFHQKKGTILRYTNVEIAEGKLPPRAQARASANIEEHDRALRLRQPAPTAIPWLSIEENHQPTILTEGELPCPDFEAELTQTATAAIADVPPCSSGLVAAVHTTSATVQAPEHVPGASSPPDRIPDLVPKVHKEVPSTKPPPAPKNNPTGDSGPGAAAQPIPLAKWKSNYTEKAWGLKVKTVKYTTNQSPGQVKVVLEFTKDLAGDQLKAVKEAFARKEGSLEFCFFDEDEVIFAKATCKDFSVEGDFSGIKEDSIRCTIPAIGIFLFLNDPVRAKQITKVELRPAPPQ
jgi:outer membrane protein TolC